MKSLLRTFLLVGALGALLSVPAFAQDDPITVLDSGRLLVFSDNRVVAVEDFDFSLQADSITISSAMQRKAHGANGAELEMKKHMALVVSAVDFGMRSYISNYEFDGHTTVQGVIPGDTVMTVYTERDGGGSADRLVQPPGRLFVMDPGLFTLFDVICHSLKGKTFTKRPVQIIALADPAQAVEATITVVGADTVVWGGRPTPVKRLKFEDPSGEFAVWIDGASRMLRLEHAQSGLVVMREAPQAPAPPKKKAAAPGRKPAAKKPAGAR